MLFHVRALSADQRLSTLTIEAASADEVRRIAAARALRVVGLREAGRSRRRRAAAGFSLTLFCQELQSLIEAGLP